MKMTARHCGPLLAAAIYALLAFALVFAIDWGVSASIAGIRTASLHGSSEDGYSQLEQETALLETEVVRLDSLVTQRELRRLPNLRDLEKLSGAHRLTLHQLERVGKTGELTQYRAVWRGRVGRLVEFLKMLKDSHILRAEYIELGPASEDGSQIALGMLLEVAKE